MSVRQKLVLPFELPQGSFMTANGELRVSNPAALGRNIRPLAAMAMFGTPEVQRWAQWAIRELAEQVGIYPASTHRLYRAEGHRSIRNTFTLPAMNLRVIAFDLAAAAFRQAGILDAMAMIFEIARSETKYTRQKPAQYASNVFAAAIEAGHRGPVFLQGDHFQVSASSYAQDPDGEMNELKALIKEAIEAGFYNIDIDASTLVTMEGTLMNQQRFNALVTAELALYIRSIEPKGITVSIGAEIGEVGGHNSTEDELLAFLNLFELEFNRLKGRWKIMAGLSKISIQTGTSHGGVVLPDGTIKDVAVDFGVLKRLGRQARRLFGLGGAVQHGASTLPDNAFSLIRQAGAIETHLATAFQMGVLKHIPDGLRNAMWQWLMVNKGERKAGETDEQYWHRMSKYSIAPFVQALWGMPEWYRLRAVANVERQFANIFKAFNIQGTADVVRRYAPHVPVPTSRPDEVAAVDYSISRRRTATPDDLAD